MFKINGYLSFEQINLCASLGKKIASAKGLNAYVLCIKGQTSIYVCFIKHNITVDGYMVNGF